MAQDDGRTPGQRLQKFMKDTRSDKRLTQREASERAGMPASTWASYEAREDIRPELDNVLAIAKGLGVPTIELLRAVEGRTGKSDTATILFNSFDSLGKQSQQIALEWVMLPDAQRVAFEAGASALLTSLRTLNQRP
jgi:transcriptional regulator with XRE-family HTH domain